jgi:U3 small nucleolar RNA-associated protein 14
MAALTEWKTRGAPSGEDSDCEDSDSESESEDEEDDDFGPL